jgi:hypothetical protein
MQKRNRALAFVLVGVIVAVGGYVVVGILQGSGYGPEILPVPREEPKAISQKLDPRAESKAVPQKLDYSKPVYTVDYAVVCRDSVILAAAFDNRADKGLDAINDAFTALWNKSDKVKAVGCEEWRGGIRVYARRMEAPFDQYIGFGFSPDADRQYVTLEPYLTNQEQQK